MDMIDKGYVACLWEHEKAVLEELLFCLEVLCGYDNVPGDFEPVLVKPLVVLGYARMVRQAAVSRYSVSYISK